MFGFYTPTFQNLDFTSYVLKDFGFYFLKFWGIWILHPQSKTSHSKMLGVVDKMLSDLKVKTKGTSKNTTCTISKKGKEIVTDEHTDSDIVSSVFAKKIFDNDLPEIKRFVGNPKPMSL